MTTQRGKERRALAKPLPEASWRRRFRRGLGAWYAKHARDLPWRRSRDPYRVWVSEIMLQQTQVATVRPYFARFVRAFPTIQALAQADEDRVLRLWEGLGYYRRARQLHQAAGIIVEHHNGIFPRDQAAVRRLPGVGRYTAGAVLSIAFDAREPILEANTVRLFSRLLGFRGDPGSKVGQELLWGAAEAFLPRAGVGAFNQALMELGSTVCRAKAPRCEACPVAALCEAHIKRLQDKIPAPKARRPLEARREAAVVLRRRGRVLLLRRPDGGRWAGLWDFPRFPIEAEHPEAAARELAAKIRQQTGVEIALGERIATITHGVTRFRITLDCYEARCVSGSEGQCTAAEMRWLRPAEVDGCPLSATGRKLGQYAVGRKKTTRSLTRPAAQASARG